MLVGEEITKTKNNCQTFLRPKIQRLGVIPEKIILYRGLKKGLKRPCLWKPKITVKANRISGPGSALKNTKYLAFKYLFKDKKN